MCGFENMSEVAPIKMIITLQTLLSRKNGSCLWKII